MQGTLVELRSGELQGESDGVVRSWKGIPYAAAQRFAMPGPPAAWQGVRNAAHYGPVAPQPEDGLIAQITKRRPGPQSEDCLSLNVWSPAEDGPLRPVMVFIHGGAYVGGEGSAPWYDGRAFAAGGDLVVVTFNYRLGALGFLHLAELFGPEFAQSGSLGILDQIAALRWVRENIAAFGGDPEQVTVFGESAGAGSIGVLLCAPQARGLFRRAILQSGSGRLLLQSPQRAGIVAQRVLERCGVAPGDLAALRAVPAKAFVDAGAEEGGLPFGPVLGTSVVPQDPLVALGAGAARGIAILTGVNRDEFRLFTLGDAAWFSEDEQVLRERIKRFARDLPEEIVRFYLEREPGATLNDRLVPLLTYFLFVRGMLATADAQSGSGASVWAYRFDWPAPAFGGRLGACHALEIPFVFRNLSVPGTDVVTGSGPEAERLAAAMQGAWIAFAKGADPNHPGLPHWTGYDTAQRAVMTFGPKMQVLYDPWASEREAWSQAYGSGVL